MDNDVTFIILGATGDLAKRKLIPAIYRLVKEQKIGKFALLAVARREMTIDSILESARPFLEEVDTATWNKLKEAAHYEAVDFNVSENFKKLKTALLTLEQGHQLSGNRLFYLATLPENFHFITLNLAKYGLISPRKNKKNSWSRIVYEKPFGYDLASARRINAGIRRVFAEEQVYRIDHYLGKELVGNIALVRFTNRILEPLWNRDHLESVQIILSEKIGLEGRGEYYDRYGALKDVVQSHLLQILALIAMEVPVKLSKDFIRHEKVKVLKRVKVRDVFLGQYRGYQQEEGVVKNSLTETFAALRLEINNPRWRDVPFFLSTGKNLQKKETKVVLKFKMIDCLLLNHCPTDSNYFEIRIEPNEGISLEMNVKVPGEIYNITPVKLDFYHRVVFGPNTPKAYEVLLQHVVEGDQSIFVRNDEIEYSWKIIDKVKKEPVFSYTPGSNGPPELIAWSKRNGVGWRI
ncbi:MAG: glucose-6-phosphate dehydrogenase [Nanoarchaeota archaeon]